ncbi:hypothetical protein BBJ28_00008427 [Nothophytophthora sp. Chile5]|nr:hypothetical protein BBJ28_00008427 [Nothophytophthora sp. Chile5]
MKDVAYPTFSSSSGPAAPSSTVTYTQAPMAHQVFAPPLHRCPPPPIAEEAAESPVHGLLRVTLKLVIFHWLNSMLGAAAFVVVAGGAALSIGLIPVCCVGLLVFRLVLYLVAVLAELDVGLANFISLPEEHISLGTPLRSSEAGARACGEDGVERLAPNLSKFSRPSLLATLYFMSVKALVGLLSSLVLSIAFSLPVGALTRGSLGDNFHGFVGLVVFLLATVLLLAIGIPLMQYVARLSRAATVYFCCETFTPAYRYVEQPATYGATELYSER